MTTTIHKLSSIYIPKKSLFILLLLACAFRIMAQPQSAKSGSNGCAIEQATKAMYEAHPGLKEKIKNQLETLENQPQQLKSGAMTGDVVPVVFHIIPTPCGVSFDFTRAELESILTDVNTDFAGQNTSEYNASIDPTFYGIRAGDVGLSFRLAEIDPYGNPTDGLTRPTTSVFSVDGLNLQTPLKEIIQWNPSRYLNVWIVQDLDGASGVAQYPITAANQPEADGIVMDHDYMKTGNATGRDNILTHEIGHWLGLLHTWGDFQYPSSCPNNAATYCECDDLVSDTPNCLGYINTVCPSTLPNSCNDGANDQPDNIHNFMDYGCEVMFTQSQETRMWNTINNNIANRSQAVTTDNDASVFMDNHPNKNDAKLYLDKVVFRESDTNPGTISETGIIELRDCGGCYFSNSIGFTASGLPASITTSNIQITRLNNTQAQISFNINLTNPNDHTDDVENISITLNSNAIIGTSQVFNNRTIGGLKIDFRREGLSYSTYASGTFANDDFTATRIPYVQSLVGFYTYQGGIYMYTNGDVEAAVTGNPLHVKRLTDNQNVNGQSFSPITAGVFGAADELIIYKPGVYTSWLNQTGYVGVKATSCGATYYAWVRIEVTSNNVNILDIVANLDNNGSLNTGQYPACDSPEGEDTSYLYLNSVNVNQINNTSGNNGGYQFFTNHTTDLIEGNTYTVNCQGGFSGTQYSGEWSVYIDLDGDGSYLNPDDLRYTIDDQTSINTNLVLIPAGTLNGQTQLNTKMMVIFSLHPISGLCENYPYGETEEYNITIKSNTGCPTTPTASDIDNAGNVYCTYAYGMCQNHTGDNKQFQLTNLSTGTTNNYYSTQHYVFFPNLTSGTNYRYRVRKQCGTSGAYGSWSPYHNFTTTSCLTSDSGNNDTVTEEEATYLRTSGFSNIHNYPNPFNTQTTIEFTLTQDTPVTLFVSDVTGRKISVLLNNEQRIDGTHQVIFDGSDHPAGMYYYTIQMGNTITTQKMTLLK